LSCGQMWNASSDSSFVPLIVDSYGKESLERAFPVGKK
jgi:hypothetical protein